MRHIVNVPEEDRATDIGNMRKKFGKDRACGSADILSDRQTERQTDTQTHSPQYFATAPVGEVTMTRSMRMMGASRGGRSWVPEPPIRGEFVIKDGIRVGYSAQYAIYAASTATVQLGK